MHVNDQRSPITYRDYVIATARHRWNVVLAVIYLAVIAGCFASGHTLAGAVILVCAVLIWLRPAAFLAIRSRRGR